MNQNTNGDSPEGKKLPSSENINSNQDNQEMKKSSNLSENPEAIRPQMGATQKPAHLKERFELPSFEKLLKQSIAIYKNKLAVLLQVSFIPSLVLILISAFVVFLEKLLGPSTLLSLAFMLLYVVGAFLMYWSIIAMIYIIKQQKRISAFEAFQETSSKFFPFLWIGFLVNVVVFAGMVFFIVPGLILAVALSFATYAYVLESQKGIAALVRSSDLTKGFRWAVFWRYLMLGGLAIIILIPFFLLASTLEESASKIANDILSWLASVFLTPLVLAFGYLIYEKLAERLPLGSYQPKKESRTFYIFMVVFGVFLASLIITISIFSAISSYMR